MRSCGEGGGLASRQGFLVQFRSSFSPSAKAYYLKSLKCKGIRNLKYSGEVF